MKLVSLSFLALIIAQVASSAESAHGNVHATALEEETLKKYLQTMDEGTDTEYVAAFRDLDGDGVDEAIVYLLGGEWCGSGGCNTLVLRQGNGAWKLVSTITIVRPPIRILEGISGGWHDIGVRVQGGGIRREYEAVLRFNGKTYPRNPSVSPAQRAAQGAAGETAIAAPLRSKPVRNK